MPVFTVTALLLGILFSRTSLFADAMGTSPPALRLAAFKSSDLSRSAVATVSGKDEMGKRIFIPGCKVDFYLKGPGAPELLGALTTDMRGQARFPFNKKPAADVNGVTTLTARLEGDPKNAPVEASLAIKDASLELALSNQDTVNLITARVVEIRPDGRQVPVPGVNVAFNVKRLFGALPLSEESTVATGEDGRAEFAFPKGIKGDVNGDVTLVARVDDNETYGNLEKTAVARWGVPLVIEKNPFPRELWEPTAPVWMIVVFSLVFGTIWSIYSFVVFQLTRLEKTEKKVGIN